MRRRISEHKPRGNQQHADPHHQQLRPRIRNERCEHAAARLIGRHRRRRREGRELIRRHVPAIGFAAQRQHAAAFAHKLHLPLRRRLRKRWITGDALQKFIVHFDLPVDLLQVGLEMFALKDEPAIVLGGGNEHATGDHARCRCTKTGSSSLLLEDHAARIPRVARELAGGVPRAGEPVTRLEISTAPGTNSRHRERFDQTESANRS